MRGRRVLDATGLDGAIRSTRGGITVNDQQVPLDDVAVLLLGSRATISGGALTMLAKYDVVVLNCDWRAVPDAVFYGWSDNSRVAARHRAQAELSGPRRKAAWQSIIKAKIKGQQRNLETVGAVETAQLKRLAKEVRSGDTSNCEAQAARIYWSAYFGGANDDYRRIPGGADRINSLLNYGYTILRGFVIQAISASGLCPTYSIWHRNRSNTFALADDLIEPFRPAVDHCVYQLGDVADLAGPMVKKALVAVSQTAMGKDGATVATCLYDLASALAMYAEGDVDMLSVPTWHPILEE
jgi:CRISP-associated protein Cas1